MTVLPPKIEVDAVSIAIWLYLGLPMLLHDAFGLRMSVLVLAAGLAGPLRLDRQ